MGGGFFGAVKEAWRSPPHGTQVSLAQTTKVVARSSALFATVGGAWSVGNCLAESLRGVDDTLNTVIGAVSAGAVVGIFGRSALLAAGAAGAFSAAAVVADVSGGRLDQRGPAELRRLMTFHDPASAEGSP